MMRSGKNTLVLLKNLLNMCCRKSRTHIKTMVSLHHHLTPLRSNNNNRERDIIPPHRPTHRDPHLHPVITPTTMQNFTTNKDTTPTTPDTREIIHVNGHSPPGWIILPEHHNTIWQRRHNHIQIYSNIR